MYVTHIDECCGRPEPDVELALLAELPVYTPGRPARKTDAPNWLEKGIEHLRSLTRDEGCCDSDQKHAVIEAWIVVEPYLTADEHDDLFDRVVGRVFPNMA